MWHLQSDQYGRDHDRVHTVYANAVHALQPRQCVTLFIRVARRESPKINMGFRECVRIVSDDPANVVSGAVEERPFRAA